MMNDEQGSPDRLPQGPDPRIWKASRDRARRRLPRGLRRRAARRQLRPSSPATPRRRSRSWRGRHRADGRGRRRAGRQRRPAGRKRGRSLWRELPILIVVALAIALVIKTFVVQPFFIPSSSMENTLLVGDKVLVNKLVYHFRSVQPGDIIVFNGVGSWNPAPPPAKPASNPVRAGLRRDAEAVVPLDRRIVRHAHRPDRLHQARHRRARRRRRVLQRAGPGYRQWRAAARVVVPVPGSRAVPDPLQQGRPGRAAVGHGRQPAISDDSRMRQNDPGGGTIPINQVVGPGFRDRLAAEPLADAADTVDVLAARHQ